MKLEELPCIDGGISSLWYILTIPEFKDEKDE